MGAVITGEIVCPAGCLDGGFAGCQCDKAKCGGGEFDVVLHSFFPQSMSDTGDKARELRREYGLK